jgi:hypothetical protein
MSGNCPILLRNFFLDIVATDGRLAFEREKQDDFAEYLCVKGDWHY